MSDDPQQPEAPQPRAPLQFTMQSMLIVMVSVAVACSVLFGLPGWAATLLFGFVLLALPGVLISMLTYGTPYQRTFAIGALVPCGCYLLHFTGHFHYALEDVTQRLVACVLLAGAGLSGLVAVMVRRAIEDHNHKKQAAASHNGDG